jgi:hypothetical protein
LNDFFPFLHVTILSNNRHIAGNLCPKVPPKEPQLVLEMISHLGIKQKLICHQNVKDPRMASNRTYEKHCYKKELGSNLTREDPKKKFINIWQGI